MLLRPLPISRIGNSLVPGVASVLIAPWPLNGALAIADSSFGDSPLSYPIVGLCVITSLGVIVGGVLLCVRGYRMGVECLADEVVVKGTLRTVRIPRAAIVGGVSEYDRVICWQGPDGVQRTTLLFMFLEGPEAPSVVERHNERCVRALRDWLISGGG